MVLTVVSQRQRNVAKLDEPSVRVRYQGLLEPRPIQYACPAPHPVRPIDMVYPPGYDYTHIDLFYGLALSPDGSHLYSLLYASPTQAAIVRWSWPDLDDPEIIVDGDLDTFRHLFGLYVDDRYVWWIMEPGPPSIQGYLRRQLITGGPVEAFADLLGDDDAPGGEGWQNYFMVGSNGKIYITFYRSITPDPPGIERGIWETGYLEIDPDVPGEYVIRQFSYAPENEALNFVDGFPITVADDGAIWQPSVAQDPYVVDGVEVDQLPGVPTSGLVLTRFDPVTGVFTSTTDEYPYLDVLVAAARNGNVYGVDYAGGVGEVDYRSGSRRVIVTPDMEVIPDPCFEGVEIPNGLSMFRDDPPPAAQFTAAVTVNVPLRTASGDGTQLPVGTLLLSVKATVQPDTPAGWTKTVDTGALGDGTSACVFEKAADTSETVTLTFPSASTGYVMAQDVEPGWDITARGFGLPGPSTAYTRTVPGSSLFWRSLGVGGGGSTTSVIYPPEFDPPSWPLGWIVWEFTTDVWAPDGTTPDGYWIQDSAAVESANHSLQFFVAREEPSGEDVFIVSPRRPRGTAAGASQIVRVSTEGRPT